MRSRRPTFRETRRGLEHVTTDWFLAAPSVLVALGFLIVPGAVPVAAWGLRGVVGIALVPASSLSMIAVAIGVCSFGRLAWTPPVLLVILLAEAVVLTAVALVLRSRGIPIRSATSETTRSSLAGVALALAAGAAIWLRLTRVIGSPVAISQAFDNVFHLNAIRYITDTGDVDPRTMNSLNHATDGIGTLYPDLWHALGSTVSVLTGASIPIVENAVNLATVCLIWPLGVVALARVLFGPRPTGYAVASAVGVSLFGFPVLLFDWGPLYPLVLSFTLVPVSFATLVVALGGASEDQLSRIGALVAFVITLPALLLSHPSSFVAILLFALPLFVLAGARRIRVAIRGPGSAVRRVVSALLPAAGLLVAVAIFEIVRPPRAAAIWPPTLSWPRAAYTALTNGYGYRPYVLVISVLTVAGIAAILVRRRRVWLLFSWALGQLLYLLTASMPVGDLRYALTGIWYSDLNRTIAVASVISLPVAAAGGVAIVDLLVGLARPSVDGGRRAPTGRGRLVRATVSGAVAVLIVVLAAVSPGMRGETAEAHGTYIQDAHSFLLTDDERAMLDRVDDYVPKGDVVAGNPSTGASLVWAFADRRALLPHIIGLRTSSEEVVSRHADEAGTRPGVCSALRRNDVRWVLDFGPYGIHGTKEGQGGFADLDRSPAWKRVAHVGPAALYELVGC